MDPNISEDNPTPEKVSEDILAPLKGYLAEQEEKDERRRKKAYGKHGKLIWNSREQGTFRKSNINRET